MKPLKLITLLLLLFSFNSMAQNNITLDFRVERQAMSTPMTPLYDMFFVSYYHARPVNVKFDGSFLNMYFDNGRALIRTALTEVERELDIDDNIVLSETIFYTNNSNVNDTITVVIDFNVGYFQVILPTRNSQDDYVGYTSYREFVSKERLAAR